MAKTIEDCWESFSRLVIPPDAPETQIREMRVAFYAGAASMFNLCDATGEPDVSLAEGCRRLNGWKAELERFAAQLSAKGRTVQ